MNLRDQVARKLAALREEHELKRAELEALIDNVDETRDMTEVEAEFDQRRADLRRVVEEIQVVERRLADLDAEVERRAAAVAVPRPEPQRGGAVVVSEERTYSPAAARRGVSILADMIGAREGDALAVERLARHRREAEVDGLVEQRAVGTGAFAGLTVPSYLAELVAEAVAAGRPFADNCCTIRQLPDSGMTVNISRITTASSAGVQATENASVSETDMDDTLLTVDVRTIAGQQTVSRQAIDRGTGVEEIVLADLARRYATVLDSQLINGSGASGQHRGVRSTSGIVTVTYTDASPTAAELWPKFHDLIQQIQAAVFQGVTHFVMHPRRWWWLASQVGTSFPFVQQISTAPWQGGQSSTRAYGGVVGSIAGVPVVVDGNVPTNLGAGTNEDVILGVTATECHLWEQPGSPLFLRIDAVTTLGVVFAVYGYSAFTAGRYPAANGTISGTGLVTPTF